MTLPYTEGQTNAQLEMENCGEKYTAEQVRRWKDSGASKPPWMPDKDWKYEELTPKQLFICRCSALMMTNEDTGKIAGVGPSTVSAIISSVAGKEEIDRIQGQFLSANVRMLEDILPIAIKTAFEVMLDPKTKSQVKAETAFRFMDRVMGRPTQKVEVEANILREVYEALDRNKVIDISSKKQEAQLAVEKKEILTVDEEKKPVDAVDDWVEKNLGG